LHFLGAGQILEFIKVKRAGDCVDPEQTLMTNTSIDDLNLEETERDIEGSHRTQPPEDYIPYQTDWSSRGQLFNRLLVRNVR